MRNERGRMDKPLRHTIVKIVLDDMFNIPMSKYHGGDMEGPSCRKLSSMALEVYPVICEHIQEFLLQEREASGNENRPSRLPTTKTTTAILVDRTSQTYYAAQSRLRPCFKFPHV